MRSGSNFDTEFVSPLDARFGDVEALAKTILDQDRYLVGDYPHATESHVVAAFQNDRVIGFLRFLVQIVGADEGRPHVFLNGSPITEAYVEAFGVDSTMRRQGVGSALQAHAIAHSREAGCYQIRSLSPITSHANYALKLAAGYVLHPSPMHDSYYFILKL